MTIKKIKISDIRKTFSCNRKQAENIREMIKSLSIEAFDEEVRREERKGIQGDIPFK